MTIYKEKMPEIVLTYKSGEINKTVIRSSVDMYNLLKQMFNSDTIQYNEEVIILFFSSGNHAIGWMRHSTGGTCHAIVDIKMIVASALKCGAGALAIAHNHPSGQMYPSREDEKITSKVKTACEALDLRFLDHIIMSGTEDEYYSFSDEGKL